MRAFTIAVVLALAVAVASAGKVHELTSANFDDHIAANDLTLVKFYAPWCGHCKSLAPEYEEAARRLDGNYFAEVDCTKESQLCQQYNVRGYPTLTLIRKDKSTASYEDARKADALVKYIKKYLLPAFTTSSSEADVKAFVANEGSDIKVVFYSTSDAETEAFKGIATAKRDDADFTIVTGAPAAKTVVYRSGAEVATLAGADADAATKLIVTEQFPLVGEIGPENYSKYAERDLPLVWAFIAYDKDEAKTVPAALEPVAAKNRENFLFVKLDSNRWGDHGKNFGVTSFPGVVIEDRKKRKNYIFPAGKEITTEAVSQFFEDYIAGKVEANVRSQDVPASNDGPVTVIVGKTWESIVMDKTKDVFVEFYAPWCGHCKALAPKYEALGEEFKSVPSVVIGMIDGTENDTPIDITGFPTLYLFPANRKNAPVQYNGARTVEDMSKFVRENADIPIAEGSARTEL